MLRSLAGIAVGLLSLTFVAAEEPKMDAPRILLVSPLGAIPGETTKFNARGLKLEGATEVKTSDARVTVKLLSQGKSKVPDKQNAAKSGDANVEFELVVPADFGTGNIELSVVTPQGESNKYAFTIGGDGPIIREKEPNPGFRQAQEVSLGQIVLGEVSNNQDVDVYAVQIEAGKKIVCETHAARIGSALDALLSVYDDSGRLLIAIDDVEGTRDACVEFVATKSGRYFIALQDADDYGGPAHPYRLSVRSQ